MSRTFLAFIMCLMIPISPTFAFPISKNLTCDKAKVILNHTREDAYFDDYTGKIYLSVDWLKTLSEGGQRLVAAHECGHAHGINNEWSADTFSVRKGKKEGWLKLEHVQEMANFNRRDGEPKRGAHLLQVWNEK